MYSELTVIVKDSEKTLRKKFGIYDEFKVDENDQVIRDCIDEVVKNYDGEPEKIQVKIHMEIQ